MAKSQVGFILTLIGGILQLIAGLMFLTGGTFLAFILPGFLRAMTLLPGIVYLAAGGVSIWQSTKMKSKDSTVVKKAGIIALISGIIGFNVIVIAGAIVALVQSKD